MTDPTPDFILGWTAAIEAAAQISGLWGASDGPSVDPEKAETATGYEAGWMDGKLHAQVAIRSIIPPGDLRAALEAMVKPLVWKVEDNGRSYHAGEYWIAYDGWSYVAAWLNCRILATCPTIEAARAAAEADNIRRVVAAIMGDEG